MKYVVFQFCMAFMLLLIGFYLGTNQENKKNEEWQKKKIEAIIACHGDVFKHDQVNLQILVNTLIYVGEEH